VESFQEDGSLLIIERLAIRTCTTLLSHLKMKCSIFRNTIFYNTDLMLSKETDDDFARFRRYAIAGNATIFF